MISSPCKYCVIRELGCHSTCEAYTEYAKKKKIEAKKSLEDRTNRQTLYEIKPNRRGRR